MTTRTPKQEIGRQAEECTDKKHADQALDLLEVNGDADSEIFFYVTFSAEAAPLNEPACTSSAGGEFFVDSTSFSWWSTHSTRFTLYIGDHLPNLALVADMLHLLVAEEAVLGIELPWYFPVAQVLYQASGALAKNR